MQSTSLTPESEKALIDLGKKQIDALFAFDDSPILDDSDFIPLLDTMIETFASVGLSSQSVSEIRSHAIEMYHQLCQSVEPDEPPEEDDVPFTYNDDVELMLSYLPPARRKVWIKSARKH